MGIVWVMPGSVFQEAGFNSAPENTMLNSPLASIRLRIAVAATAWKSKGGENLFLNPEDCSCVQSIPENNDKIFFIGKFFPDCNLDKWLAICRLAKEKNYPMVVDISDNPFVSKFENVKIFYKEMMRLADMIVTNSIRMRELMEIEAGRSCRAIDDAVLSGIRKPQFSPKNRMELLWFGHPSNLQYLERCLPSLIELSYIKRCRLVIVTLPGGGVESAALNITALHRPRFEVKFIPWSLNATRLALRECDLVLIPGDPLSAAKSGVSSNRLAEALQAGRLPVASPMMGYLPFSDSALLGENIASGVLWALSNRREVLARIHQGQRRVAENLSQEVIGERWCELFDGILGNNAH
jgi:hypothetical protein